MPESITSESRRTRMSQSSQSVSPRISASTTMCCRASISFCGGPTSITATGKTARSPAEAQMKLVERLAARLEIARDHRVLDIGSGLGGSACWLAKTFGCSVLGLTLSPVQAQAAEKRASEEGVSDLASFREHDANNLDLPSEIIRPRLDHRVQRAHPRQTDLLPRLCPAASSRRPAGTVRLAQGRRERSRARPTRPGDLRGHALPVPADHGRADGHAGEGRLPRHRRRQHHGQRPAHVGTLHQACEQSAGPDVPVHQGRASSADSSIRSS